MPERKLFSLVRRHRRRISSCRRQDFVARPAGDFVPKGFRFSKTPPPHAKLAFHPPTMATSSIPARRAGERWKAGVNPLCGL